MVDYERIKLKRLNTILDGGEKQNEPPRANARGILSPSTALRTSAFVLPGIEPGSNDGDEGYLSMMTLDAVHGSLFGQNAVQLHENIAFAFAVSGDKFKRPVWPGFLSVFEEDVGSFFFG